MSYTPVYVLLAVILAAAGIFLLVRQVGRVRRGRVSRSAHAQRQRNDAAWARRNDHRRK